MKDLPITMMPDGWMEKTGGYAKDMTLRDHFAALAMQALIAHEERAKPLGSCNLGDFDVRVAVCAYRYADEMLKAGQ